MILSSDGRESIRGAAYDSAVIGLWVKEREDTFMREINEWREGMQIEPAVPKQIVGCRYEDCGPREPEHYLDRARTWTEKYINSCRD